MDLRTNTHDYSRVTDPQPQRADPHRSWQSMRVRVRSWIPSLGVLVEDAPPFVELDASPSRSEENSDDRDFVVWGSLPLHSDRHATAGLTVNAAGEPPVFEHRSGAASQSRECLDMCRVV